MIENIRTFFRRLVGAEKHEQDRKRLAELEAQAQARVDRVAQLEREVEALSETIWLIRNSASWKVTAPARAVFGWMMQVRHAIISSLRKPGAADRRQGQGELPRTNISKSMPIGTYAELDVRLGVAERDALKKALRAIKKDIRKEL
jgi:hypothetical protein